jgi:membrane-bound lytic murein transglycosylase MltF
MKLCKCLILFAACLLVLTFNSPCIGSAEKSGKAKAPILDPEVLRSTEDIAAMKDRHFVRVLVSYSRTNYFLDGHANERGFEFELMKQYEKFFNKGLKRGGFKTFIIFIPVPFNRLIPELLDGHGDIIASGLTVTSDREEKIAFTDPYITDVNEVVVTHKSVEDLKTLEDLSGREVYCLRGSSYEQHLRALNKRFKKEGRKPVEVIEASEYLATEDILEMVNAGIVKITIADSHLATIWKDVLPDIRVHGQIALNIGGRIAWGVRKDNPELLSSLNAFVKQAGKGTLIGNVLFKKYYQNTKWVENPLAEEERKKLDAVIKLFKKYADEYDFEWLAIAAQAYQESKLDQSLRSPAGAIGIMQIKPETASDPRVNIPDIEILENNIHAGVKYLDWLRDTYFSGPEVSEEDQINFSFAAYNAGPRRVARLRKKAERKGLDANKWFQNVEIVARKDIGTETVRYVRNIHKYYIAYKILVEGAQKKKEELEAHKSKRRQR